MVYVTLHAAWMVLAVAIGTVAGYLGLVRATQGAGGASALPGRFKMQAHTTLGLVYYVMLYVGLLSGIAMHRWLLPEHVLPDGVRMLHLVLGIVVVALYTAAWVIGSGLVKKPAGADRARPRLHMVCNYTACTLIAVQIAVAVYYVWIWPNT